MIRVLESNLKSTLTAVSKTLNRVVSPTPLQQENHISTTTSDSGNKATAHMDTGDGSRITAMASEHNTQTPMQGLADAHNSLANDHHGGDLYIKQFGKGFLLILDNLFDLHCCTLKVTILCKNMTINTAMEIILPPLVTPNQSNQFIKSIHLGMVLDVMMGIMIKAKTHRGPSKTSIGTTKITMTINHIKLHQFLASMMNINAQSPSIFSGKCR